MRDQRIKEETSKNRCPNFTEQEDIVIKLVFSNTEGSTWDKATSAAGILNKTAKSIRYRYYTLMRPGRSKEVEIPGGFYNPVRTEQKKRSSNQGSIEMKVPDVPKMNKTRKRVKIENPSEGVKTLSKWRRIINILFNK